MKIQDKHIYHICQISGKSLEKQETKNDVETNKQEEMNISSEDSAKEGKQGQDAKTQLEFKKITSEKVLSDGFDEHEGTVYPKGTLVETHSQYNLLMNDSYIGQFWTIIDKISNTCEVGYNIVEQFTNKGYATKGLAQFIKEIGSLDTDISKFILKIAEENGYSQKVAENNGFKINKEGQYEKGNEYLKEYPQEHQDNIYESTNEYDNLEANFFDEYMNQVATQGIAMTEEGQKEFIGQKFADIYKSRFEGDKKELAGMFAHLEYDALYDSRMNQNEFDSHEKYLLAMSKAENVEEYGNVYIATYEEKTGDGNFKQVYEYYSLNKDGELEFIDALDKNVLQGQQVAVLTQQENMLQGQVVSDINRQEIQYELSEYIKEQQVDKEETKIQNLKNISLEEEDEYNGIGFVNSEIDDEEEPAIASTSKKVLNIEDAVGFDVDLPFGYQVNQFFQERSAGQRLNLNTLGKGVVIPTQDKTGEKNAIGGFENRNIERFTEKKGRMM